MPRKRIIVHDIETRNKEQKKSRANELETRIDNERKENRKWKQKTLKVNGTEDGKLLFRKSLDKECDTCILGAGTTYYTYSCKTAFSNQ